MEFYKEKTNICPFLRTFVNMSYEDNNIRNWLIEHSLINISKLEQDCDIPKDTIRHFKEDRRNLPLKHKKSLVDAIAKYGYKSLTDE